LTAACVALAVAGVHREFLSPAPARRDTSVREPRWADLQSKGRLIGPSTAKIKVVEFTDFQCPYCKKFHGVMTGLLSQFGDQISLRVIHYPLDNHKSARSAAIAAECAGQQDRFTAFGDSLFAKQDSLGRRPWSTFAREAGVVDSARFAACITSTSSAQIVEGNRLLGDMMKLTGTPTVIINGTRYTSPPSDSLIRSLLVAK
jgi:protein-disulfide isomerase